MCIVLLLVTRDLCLKLGAVVLTGDFNKAVERETLSDDSGDRRISPPEAAFSYACVPWPTSGWQQMAGVLRSRHVARAAEPVAHPATRFVRRPFRQRSQAHRPAVARRAVASPQILLDVSAEVPRPRLIRTPEGRN